MSERGHLAAPRRSAGAIRNVGRADNQLEDLVAEIDTAMAMRGMSEPSIYYGEWCSGCRKDCIPMPDGTCGWCGTAVVDPA